EYWAIDISSVSIGKEKYSFSRPLATLVDTGSTMVFLPGAVLDKLFGSIQGAGTDADGVVVVPCQSQQLTSIGFHVGNYELSFDPEDYIMPNQSTDGMCPTYFMESDGGLEMLLGYGFLQHYVSIYDQEKKRIGLAKRR
ncbi:aspartic peptidase domain-containing protein, partial [Cunninghamella echinulata]